MPSSRATVRPGRDPNSSLVFGGEIGKSDSSRGDGEPLYSGHCYCADCKKASESGFIPFMGFASASSAILRHLHPALPSSTGWRLRIVRCRLAGWKDEGSSSEPA